MLSAIMLSAIMLSAIRLSAIRLSTIMLSAIMLGVVVPSAAVCYRYLKNALLCQFVLRCSKLVCLSITFQFRIIMGAIIKL
jgi:hypothetical protein